MKIILIASALITLAGCGAWDRTVATYTGIAHTCVDGVEYLQFTSGASVAYTTDGRIKTCKP